MKSAQRKEVLISHKSLPSRQVTQRVRENLLHSLRAAQGKCKRKSILEIL